MKHLKKYESFEELKNDVSDENVTEDLLNERQEELKEFIELLQKNGTFIKKNSSGE